MSQITNDVDFKQALLDLDPAEQRAVAAKFVEHVLPLSRDERINRAVKVAADTEATADEISNALKTAKAATIDGHTRCGSEGDWTEQASYFVSRAAMAALTPCEQCASNSPAWQAAMSSRMAQTSILIDDESKEQPTHYENEWQYVALSEHLKHKERI